MGKELEVREEDFQDHARQFLEDLISKVRHTQQNKSTKRLPPIKAETSTQDQTIYNS